MIYLGTPGRMVELKCPASQQVQPQDGYSFETTAEGRVRGQARPARGRRSWSVSTSDATTPKEQSAIMAFVNGEWGPGPFWFVSAEAPVTNLLSPDAASCDPAEAVLGSGTILTGTPPMLTPDGWAGRSYTKSTTNVLFFGASIPCLPGVKVTASAYVTGNAGAVRIYWYGPGGTVDPLGSNESSLKSTTTTVVRAHVTATPPAGAVSFRVATNASVTQACRPAATWTDSLFDPADGQGCPKAVLHGASRSLVLASRNARGGQYSNLSYTVQEVG